MRRDYFTVDFRCDTDGGVPTIAITYDGPSGDLRDRLTKTVAETLDSSEIDIAFRRQADEEQGVLSLTDRMTGEFVFEVVTAGDDIETLVSAAQRHEGDGEYRVRLQDNDGQPLAYEKQTLLVYDHDGSLLRHRSLIPGGVEL